MTNDKTLKEICDMIWFENWSFIFNKKTNFYESSISANWYNRVINPVEIIFTSEFINKFTKYLKNKRLYTKERQEQIDNFDKENYIPDEQIEIQCDYAMFWLLYNLDNPTSYLANLLGLWTKKN